ncbi:condensin complex subunit 1 isoform X3 [Alligator mississippiensis]|uniref:condensin complex subunit 1 isoform X3 n=1 Tax=Alligator mississippiensis TaxID=8496 RepID=UPI002877F720|nr:condensin complex subunit 1 isoform X3 [Alligator mississippiensis]
MASPPGAAWEFQLPLCPGDLLRSGGSASPRLLPPAQLSGALAAFGAAFGAQGPRAVLQHFDALCSLLHHFHTVDAAIKEDALDLMKKVVSSHYNDLPSILDDPGLSSSDCLAHRNALKMNCYVLTRLVEAFETESFKRDSVELSLGGRNKKGCAKRSGFSWEEERQPLIQLLTELLQLDLRRLWSGLVVEEEFVSLMTGICYRILENPTINHQKHRPTREAVIHLLAVTLMRYDHMLSATLKITQMLQHFEHVAPLFGGAVSLWATEYGMKSIVGELLREIGQKCPQNLARDASGAKGYAVFLTELAEQIPGMVLSNMSVLLHHLDGENYTMRNAILTAMAEILLQVLNGDQLEEAVRSTRDQFLDMLQAHVCDVLGHVRSRVLQLFTRIVQRKALPLTRFQTVVCLAVGRLQDKSVMVVKNAVQLLAAFLSNNPFSCKISCSDLAEPLKKEMQKLHEMRDKHKAASALAITPEEEWEAMQPELKAMVQQLLHPLQGEEEREVAVEVEDTAQDTAEHIIQLLRKLNYKAAVCLTQEAVSCFQGIEPFISTSELKDDKEAMILGILKALYTGSHLKNCVPKPLNDSDNTESEDLAVVEQLASEMVKQEMLVQYLQDAYNFSVKIMEATSMVSRMMYGNSVSVVQEAIEFFVTVSQFGVPQAVLGVRRMLPLIWSKELSIREAVLSAYRRLYLSPSGDSERVRAQNQVQSLSLLMVDASLGTIQCLEEIISEFVQKDEIKPSVIQLLWEQFTEKSQCSSLERQAAIMLLGMMARGKPEIVGSNLDVLVTVGLDEKVHKDYGFAKEVCNAISKLAGCNKVAILSSMVALARLTASLQARAEEPALEKSQAPFRLPETHLLFEWLSDAVSAGFDQPSTLWLPFMEAAVNLIYQLAEGPEEICAQILKDCSQKTLDGLLDLPAELEASPGSIPGGTNALPTFLLTHLISLVGHVALQQVVYLEGAVSAELRRRRVLREEQEAKKRAASSTKEQSAKDTGNETTMEEDLGLVGASADDTEAELVRNICETELLDEKQLFSTFMPLVLKICNNPLVYRDPALSAAAALALGKFCMISAEFCDSQLRLLFTMLEKSSLPGVRSNLMIVAGDLAIRFPNLIEPWTPHLYARLRDPCHDVRQIAGLVMTHLILKDMVKVKGQVSEMATLLIDPEEEIVRLAQNFFSELSSKGNAIYNLLPDIISRLSDPDCGVDEESFHTIMRHLFSYITKDKQAESLVEKLCQRFRTAKTERQFRDLSHCLMLLPLSDRGLHKMQENFDCFADKLQDPAVYRCFRATLSRLHRGGTKPETKVLIEELEQKLHACHNRGLDSIEAPGEIPGQESSQTPVPGPAKKRPVAGSQRRQPLRVANREVDSPFITPPPRMTRHHRNASKRNPSRRPAITVSSDEENSLEEDELSAELKEDETPTKKTPISRASACRAR